MSSESAMSSEFRRERARLRSLAKELLPLPPAARNSQLDTVRGIACFLLVAYHAIGSTYEGGLKFPEGNWIHDVNAAIGYLRMPLFTFLSGYVYSRMPVDWSGLGRFWQKKAMRLLVPMVVVGTIYFLGSAYGPGVNAPIRPSDLLQVFFFPVTLYWYIQALMIVFIIVGLVEAAGLLRGYRNAIVVFVVATLVFDIRNFFPEFFSINRSLYLLPFFLSGLLLARFGPDVRRAAVYPLAWLVLYLALAHLFGRQHDVDSGFMLLVGVTTSLVLMKVTPSINWVAFIGFYSYTIFLYHVFGYSAARVALQHLGMENRYLLLPLVVAAGIVSPILVHLAVARIPVVSRLLLGIKPGNRSGRFNADRVATTGTLHSGR